MNMVKGETFQLSLLLLTGGAEKECQGLWQGLMLD